MYLTPAIVAYPIEKVNDILTKYDISNIRISSDRNTVCHFDWFS